MAATQSEKALRFRRQHDGPGALLIANAWDAGSARVLAGLGFQALATSSGACAGTLGRRDGAVTREETLAHARAATSLYRAAMSGLVEAARELKASGSFGYLDRALTTPELNAYMHP